MARQDLDVAAITAQLDEEFSQEEVAEEAAEPETQVQDYPTEEEEVYEAETEAEEPVDEADDDEPQEEEVDEPSPVDPDVHKRNEAFKKLREERDQLAKSDAFLTNLAEQYGITKDQLIERYQQDLDKKRAKESGMTEEQFRKMRELEQKVQQIEESKNRELFNVKANQIATQYNLSDDEMMELFTEARNMDLDILSKPELLDVVYRSMNYDQAIERGRQAQLETSKKRKATSTGRTGTAGKQVDTTEQDMEKEIEAFLKEQNIIREK